MVDFDLKKKWIKDAIFPKEIQKYNIPDKDLTGGWEYIDENTVFKYIETNIMNYKRRLLVTARFENIDEEHSRMIIVGAEEVNLQ